MNFAWSKDDISCSIYSYIMDTNPFFFEVGAFIDVSINLTIFGWFNPFKTDISLTAFNGTPSFILIGIFLSATIILSLFSVKYADLYTLPYEPCPILFLWFISVINWSASFDELYEFAE